MPGLDPLLRAVAAHRPEAVRPGVPAHLTVLYPFLPAEQLTEQTVGRCRELCAGTGPLRLRFDHVEAGPSMVFLAPVPAAPVAALTRSFIAQWPQCPPYGGRFGPEPAPHLTLTLAPGPDTGPGTGPAPGTDPDEGARIAALAEGFLPVETEPAVAVLVELTDSGWAQRAVLPL